ncbi:hypothetical protein LIER_27651 [Lithospermum erythrorhizon]|uniref:Protein kinase domain-containing protein n=1 Tax=Lithospermum erythrorhizon TaxID=34254 RepID=A0AAV3RCR4_LITER
MAKGSLENQLYNHVDKQACLTWEQRVNICIGAARGLNFLHGVFESGVIHRHVNCSNIMLDDNFVPKIADFGIAKLANDGDDTITTHICGTIGYLAPEYLVFGKVTKKIDVFGFGVVLLVVLSGRRHNDYVSYGDDGRYYPMCVHLWAEKCIRENKVDKLIDPELIGQFKSESVVKFLEVAQNCLHPQPDKRHTMEEVVAGLELALEKQLSSTYTHWIESHEPPNLQYLQPQNERKYSSSSKLYDKFVHGI